MMTTTSSGLASRARTLGVRIALVVLAALLLVPEAATAAAEEIALARRFRAGETYPLHLTVVTKTEGTSKGIEGSSLEEDVKLTYRADVVVLEVDDAGRPVRERHQRPQLTFERPGEAGSLFKEGVAYEVERSDRIRLSAGGRPLDAKVEQTVAAVLEKQPELTLEPAVLDPGRPVSVGESWMLSESLVERWLQSRGVRVIALGEAPRATLVRHVREDGQPELAVEYEIPIERFALTRMPPHAQPSRSDATLSGRVRLGRDPGEGPIASVSELNLALSGISSGPARRLPWSVRSLELVERSTGEARDVALTVQPVR